MIHERLHHVGRLDFLSSGLIFYTNDGEFTRLVAHPSSQIEKEYLVETGRPVEEAFLRQYAKGMRVEDTVYRCKSYVLRGPKSVLITLTEGKNRELRKVFMSRNIRVKRIHRLRIGPVTLAGLPTGHFRRLNEREVRWFHSHGGERPGRTGPPRASIRPAPWWGPPGARSMIVAIDGPAGVGKSTIARRSAERSGFQYINSGSFYRAITLAALRSGAEPSDTQRVLAAARAARLDISPQGLLLNGELVEGLLHSDRVDASVAQLSSIPEVRAIVNERLRQIAQGRDAVVEGRDIGTVVFPHAELKVYLDADVRTRASRRHAQGTSSLSLSELEKTIRERDHLDRTKPAGPLVEDPNAMRIDTTHLTIDEVCDRVEIAIRVRKNNPGDIRQL